MVLQSVRRRSFLSWGKFKRHSDIPRRIGSFLKWTETSVARGPINCANVVVQDEFERLPWIGPTNVETKCKKKPWLRIYLGIYIRKVNTSNVASPREPSKQANLLINWSFIWLATNFLADCFFYLKLENERRTNKMWLENWTQQARSAPFYGLITEEAEGSNC